MKRQSNARVKATAADSMEAGFDAVPEGCGVVIADGKGDNLFILDRNDSLA
jgi:hypothetical protein